MTAGVRSKCLICGKDYAENLYSLLYCLTDDISVCDSCIARKKVKVDEDGKWQCPKCKNWLTVEESRLFKQD